MLCVVFCGNEICGAWCTREKKNVYKVLVEKPKGTIPPARSRLRWKSTTKAALEDNGWEGMDSITQKHVPGSCKHCNEPSASIKYGFLAKLKKH